MQIPEKNNKLTHTMKKQTIYILLVLLICVSVLTYIFTPRKFEVEGGSCYQGITAAIIHFFLKICTVLNLFTLFFLSRAKINAPKKLSLIAALLWTFITFIILINETGKDFGIAILYFSPFLIVNFLIYIIIKRSKATKIPRPI